MADQGSYQNLDPTQIVETIERLTQRIDERFPDSGLGGVCRELLRVGRQAEERSEWIGKPILWLRITSWVFAVLIAVGIVVTVGTAPVRFQATTASELVSLVEAGTNEIIALGAGLFFLVTLESRIKRRRALSAIHELRSIAHIIDMHQLTKDPERVLGPKLLTPSSPALSLDRFQLGRYLDYCSEMLSLTGKVAALYVQRFDDSVALASTAEVETLVTGLSSKIWQKIVVLHATDADEA